MSNLSQGIREDAIAEIIVNMYKHGFIVEQIANAVEKSAEEIMAIIKKREHTLA